MHVRRIEFTFTFTVEIFTLNSILHFYISHTWYIDVLFHLCHKFSNFSQLLTCLFVLSQLSKVSE